MLLQLAGALSCGGARLYGHTSPGVCSPLEVHGSSWTRGRVSVDSSSTRPAGGLTPEGFLCWVLLCASVSPVCSRLSERQGPSLCTTHPPSTRTRLAEANWAPEVLSGSGAGS